MSKLFKKSVFIMIFACAGLMLFISGARAQQSEAVSMATLQTAEDVKAYWTPERMQEAIPMPMGNFVKDAAADIGTAYESELSQDAKPGYAPGWSPESGLPQPDSNTWIEITPDDPLYVVATGVAQPQHGTPPSSPPSSPTDYAGYSPFQRTNFAGRYLTYPRSTIGKMFFSQDHDGDGNYSSFVCSGSVIQKNTVATAGHCIHNGLNGLGAGSGWSTNILFCPSYNQGGINSTSGCWAGTYRATSGWWFGSSGSDRDYGCFVTASTGTVVSDRIGNFTGWTGRAANWDNRQPIYAWGYPQGAPFNGTVIIVSTSTEWYTRDMTSGDGQVSKYIGNDMTGGSSGGPWWLNYNHPWQNFPDVDGSSITDPMQTSAAASPPYINGVNSHRACSQAGCPPGSVYLSEMGSPEFHSSDGDGDESEDVFALCFSNGGS